MGHGPGDWGSRWLREISAAGWGHLESDSSLTAQPMGHFQLAPARAHEVSRATSSSTCSAALRCEEFGTSGGCLGNRRGVGLWGGARRSSLTEESQDPVAFEVVEFNGRCEAVKLLLPSREQKEEAGATETEPKKGRGIWGSPRFLAMSQVGKEPREVLGQTVEGPGGSRSRPDFSPFCAPSPPSASFCLGLDLLRTQRSHGSLLSR